MPSIVALIFCVILIITLLRIERGRHPEGSGMIWVPTLFLILSGSKPIARWFESNAMAVSGGSEEAGSPLDRIVLIILMTIAFFVISRRRIEWSRILRDNFWLIVLFSYLGMSTLWSNFPFVSLKRWIRLSGAIPIIMIVLTERYPLRALESVFRRCAYVLIPFSLLLIKYFPNLGVAYVTWSGEKMWVGVSSQKNGLGLICALSAFLIFWSFNREWRTGIFFRNKSQTFADGLVFAIAVFLLNGFNNAYSATALGVLVLGIVSLLLLYKAKNYVRQMAAFLVFGLGVVLLSLPFVESMASTVTSAFQRNASFTGRTDIWNAVLEVASRTPWFGVGYGGYWGVADEKIYSALGVREAHSGYLDVYLEVGIVGIVLLFVFLLSHYRKVLRELNYAHEWSVFGICLLMMSMVHNFTESNFIVTSSYFWNAIMFITITFSEPIFRRPSSFQNMNNIKVSSGDEHMTPSFESKLQKNSLARHNN